MLFVRGIVFLVLGFGLALGFSFVYDPDHPLYQHISNVWHPAKHIDVANVEPSLTPFVESTSVAERRLAEPMRANRAEKESRYPHGSQSLQGTIVTGSLFDMKSIHTPLDANIGSPIRLRVETGQFTKPAGTASNHAQLETEQSDSSDRPIQKHRPKLPTKVGKTLKINPLKSQSMLALRTEGVLTQAQLPARQPRAAKAQAYVAAKSIVEPEPVKKLANIAAKVKIHEPSKAHRWVLHDLPKSSYSKRQRKCLVEAIYFEARGEVEKGQAAVAQVVLNRVKNPSYSNTVCGVVYQNQHRRWKCQFSFACDRQSERMVDKRSRRIAEKVADAALSGQVWLKRVGASTHYHAVYVRPKWSYTMRRLEKIGRHIFYKTHNGGWS